MEKFLEPIQKQKYTRVEKNDDLLQSENFKSKYEPLLNGNGRRGVEDPTRKFGVPYVCVGLPISSFLRREFFGEVVVNRFVSCSLRTHSSGMGA